MVKGAVFVSYLSLKRTLYYCWFPLNIDLFKYSQNTFSLPRGNKIFPLREFWGSGQSTGFWPQSLPSMSWGQSTEHTTQQEFNHLKNEVNNLQGCYQDQISQRRCRNAAHTTPGTPPVWSKTSMWLPLLTLDDLESKPAGLMSATKRLIPTKVTTVHPPGKKTASAQATHLASPEPRCTEL